jgi:uncharacterized protein (DUF1800 family)
MKRGSTAPKAAIPARRLRCAFVHLLKDRAMSYDRPLANEPEPVEPAERDELAKTLKPLNPKFFGEAQARHLLWRAGFGGTPAQLRTLVSWGVEKSVDYLINYGDIPFESPDAASFDKDIMRPPSEEERQKYAAARRAQNEDLLAEVREERQRRERSDRQQMAEVQKWWLKRMIETPRPLEEKLTLFWHGHFATNFRTIENSYHMFKQNQLFRTHATGNFGELLHAIIRDPAMIAYLDNNDSRKGRPNENLAREIMELFSLGIGNYTERDIKEGARALTGFTFTDDEFTFQKNNHDTGSKDILGVSGNLDGDGFVQAILSKRDCARFIARKMYHFFVADVPPDERGGATDLDPAQKSVLRQMSSKLLLNKYELKPMLKLLFTSEHFYEPRFMNQQIKSPSQLVVGSIRSLEAPPRDLSILNDALDLMGQRLFFPPSVKGWDGGRSWINTSTYFVRQNTLAFILTGKKPQGYDATRATDPFDPFALLSEGDRSRETITDAILRLTLGQTPAHARATLNAHLATCSEINTETATQLFLLATATPEYQLC